MVHRRFGSIALLLGKGSSTRMNFFIMPVKFRQSGRVYKLRKTGNSMQLYDYENIGEKQNLALKPELTQS